MLVRLLRRPECVKAANRGRPWEATRSADAALCGLGLSVKSVAHVWEDLREGRLVSVMQDYPVARSGNFWAVYPPAQPTPPKVAVLIDFLLSKYGRPPYWERDS